MPIFYATATGTLPTPGDAITTATGERLTIEQARQRFCVAPIIERYGTWAVTEYGIESLACSYAVSKDCLHDPVWRALLMAKRWDDPINAHRVWESACKHHKVELAE